MRHIEENTQIACVTWFSYQYPQYIPLLHHSPNGGYRNSKEAGRFKAMGTRAGFPDLVLLIAKGGCHGLFIELKSKDGEQTKLQRAYQEAVEEQGYKYVICRNVEEFIYNISEYMGKA